MQLAAELEGFFGASGVDLVILTEADPFLAAAVIRGERLFAEDSYLADEYDLYVLRRAGDLAPLERERIALILESRPEGCPPSAEKFRVQGCGRDPAGGGKP